MSNIKALEDLRVYAYGWRNGFGGHPSDVETLADRIEQEIAEHYMPLPCDADGVPIHCGDRMRLDNGHEGEVWLIGAQDIMMSDHTCFDWARSRHVKPRTLEDVLASYRFDAQNIYEDPMLNGNQRVDELEALDGKVAAEIRELMGVSE